MVQFHATDFSTHWCMLWRCRIPVFLHATSRQRFLAFKSVSMIPTPWTGIYLSEIGVSKGERQEAITGTRCYVRPLLSGYSDPVDINHLEQLYLFAKKQSAAADEHLRTSLSRCAAHAAPEAQTSKLSRRTQSLTRYRTRSLSAEKIRTHPILFPARRDSPLFPCQALGFAQAILQQCLIPGTYTGERLPMLQP